MKWSSLQQRVGKFSPKRFSSIGSCYKLDRSLLLN
jgi:hypothetical protein